jgi:threonylcarbamoyladenosine tRNA methylthiotransferase MtaB
MTSLITAGNSPRVVIETHGCKLNQADTSVLASDFLRAGFTLASNDDEVDVYVVNTCTVTHVADRKARQALRTARRRHPRATIVATGCYAQRDPEGLNGLEEIDLVLGNTAKAELVRRVLDLRGDSLTPCAEGEEPAAHRVRTGRTRAMVKIQEGCNQVCAYCIVPRVRGRERSVPPEQLIGLVNRRIAEGYLEIVLTGTQLGTYGYDLPGTGLVDLVRRVLEETDVTRLRVSSLQPQEIGADLLALWSDRRLCPHFHIPLQSGSAAILHRMRRRYSPEEYRNAVDRVRRFVPDVSITADVIVGFPGETEADFEATRSLCAEVGFAAVHVFPYSTRPGTSAAHFRDAVGAATRTTWLQELSSIAASGAAAFRNGFLGTTRLVLWENRVGGAVPGTWSGLTDNYLRVAAHSDEELANAVTDARLLRLDGNVIRAEIADPRQTPVPMPQSLSPSP